MSGDYIDKVINKAGDEFTEPDVDFLARSFIVLSMMRLKLIDLSALKEDEERNILDAFSVVAGHLVYAYPEFKALLTK